MILIELHKKTLFCCVRSLFLLAHGLLTSSLFSLGRPLLFCDVMLELDFPISCNHIPCDVCPCAGDCSYFQFGVDDDEKTDWFSFFDCTTTEESST